MGWGPGAQRPTGGGARVLVQVPWEASGLLSLTPSQPSPWPLKVWSLERQPGPHLESW